MRTPVSVESSRFLVCYPTRTRIGMFRQVSEYSRDRSDGTMQDGPQTVGDRAKDYVALAVVEKAVLCS